MKNRVRPTDFSLVVAHPPFDGRVDGSRLFKRPARGLLLAGFPRVMDAGLTSIAHGDIATEMQSHAVVHVGVASGRSMSEMHPDPRDKGARQMMRPHHACRIPKWPSAGCLWVCACDLKAGGAVRSTQPPKKDKPPGTQRQDVAGDGASDKIPRSHSSSILSVDCR